FKRHRADPRTGIAAAPEEAGAVRGQAGPAGAGGAAGDVGPPDDEPDAPDRVRDGNGDGGDLAPEAAIDPATGRPRRFAYPPNLYLVDGGAPQVAAAAEVLDELGVTDVALAGLAKRLEEVWVPGDDEPVILPRGSDALYLLQRVRDEAHRFAIRY